jgi:hypothetical protein
MMSTDLPNAVSLALLRGQRGRGPVRCRLEDRVRLSIVDIAEVVEELTEKCDGRMIGHNVPARLERYEMYAHRGPQPVDNGSEQPRNVRSRRRCSIWTFHYLVEVPSKFSYGTCVIRFSFGLCFTVHLGYRCAEPHSSFNVRGRQLRLGLGSV